jgi:hypothetical protein
LFSQDRVADFINKSFEPAWESVRPVPIVRIDFGNGNVLTRTLHGNVLTSICTPAGFVMDALPGIYTESAYLRQLELLHGIATAISSLPADRREDALIAVHRVQTNLFEEKAERGDFSKFTLEDPIKKAIRPPGKVKAASAKQAAKPPLNAAEDVARWKALEEDTRLNERTRRRQIHELLAWTGLGRPNKVTRSIYKDVLHADLDDPYLGLGEVLFATYPFAKEDAVH